MVILGGWVFLMSEVPLHCMQQQNVLRVRRLGAQGYASRSSRPGERAGQGEATGVPRS